MTRPLHREPGRHRDTGPLPVLLDIPGAPWAQDGGRRHLAPAATPRPPMPPPGEDAETTGQFSLAELAAATGAHLVRLPLAPRGSDPEETGEIPVGPPPGALLLPWEDSTGPVRLPSPTPRGDEPSMTWAWAGCGALIVAFSFVILMIRFGVA